MYQYKLTFKLEKKCLPRTYDKILVSFLKASAQAYAAEFYNGLYDKSKSIIKNYTFSCYLPGAKFLGEQIVPDRNEFSLFFSDADPIELLQFFNGFQKMKYKKYPMNGNSMELVSIHMQQMHEIKENEIVIRMQSPLLVRRHDADHNTDRYYTYDMEEFNDALKENVLFFLKKTDWNISADDFSIQVIKGKKVVVPILGRNTDASLGVYKLTGSVELLNLLYLAGIGVRRSLGKGKWEVIA